jgi:hypothetical protein
MVNWLYFAVGVFALAGAIFSAVVQFKMLRRTSPSPLRPDPPAPRPTGSILTPPPSPIDRNEFLQARIAYLAHMRDIGIEVEETDESGNLKKHVRPAKPAEMIEGVNIRDEDHVVQLFATWDEVQRKQRDGRT